MNFKCSIMALCTHILSPVLGVVILIVAGGCNENVGVSDEIEREHPDMKKAMVLEDQGDLRAARNVYESILDRDPTLARAHLALAFLLDKTGDDHVGSIYHFRRYLALRPDTEKKAMIESHIRSETLNVVGSVFTNQASVLVRMGEVERENKALKTRVSNLQAQMAQLRAALAAVRAKYGVSTKP
ncbi:MAG: tetratricopeptide repeat protein [bacterium]